MTEAIALVSAVISALAGVAFLIIEIRKAKKSWKRRSDNQQRQV
jgi:hypothetical protein